MHAFGHYHDESGVSHAPVHTDSDSRLRHGRRRIVLVNGAICDNLYRAVNPPTVLDIPVGKGR